MLKEIGERIKALRGPLSQAELGRLVGATQSAVQSWESGKSNPASKYILKMLQVELQPGVMANPDFLLNGVGATYINKESKKSVSESKALWGKARHHVVDDTPVVVTEFSPDGPAQTPSDKTFWAMMKGVKEILDSGDPVLVPTLQTAVESMRLSVKRNRHSRQQQDIITQLRVECDVLKERLGKLEEKIKEGEEPADPAGSTEKMII